MSPLPTPARASIGLAAIAISSVRESPRKLVEVPVIAVGTVLQLSLRAQQRYAELVARGDEVLDHLRGAPEEPPSWATFDEAPAEPGSVGDPRAAATTAAAATDLADALEEEALAELLEAEALAVLEEAEAENLAEAIDTADLADLAAEPSAAEPSAEEPSAEEPSARSHRSKQAGREEGPSESLGAPPQQPGHGRGDGQRTADRAAGPVTGRRRSRRWRGRGPARGLMARLSRRPRSRSPFGW